MAATPWAPTSLAGALLGAVIASALVRATVSPDTELATEAVCWIVLAAGARRGGISSPASASSPADSNSASRDHAKCERPPHRARRQARRLLVGRTMAAAIVAGALSRSVADARWVAVRFFFFFRCTSPS
jgi:hypothetical protein